MERTTTNEAFMRGFYKAAFDAGLSPDQAAELHALAIIDEAKQRSSEFARGFDKIAGVYPWYHPGRWFGMKPTPTEWTPASSELLTRMRQTFPEESAQVYPASPPPPTTTVQKRKPLPSDSYSPELLEKLLKTPSDPNMDFRIKSPSGITGARG